MPSEIDIAILHNAILENTNIFIRKERGKDEYSYFSRFLSFNKKEETIFIDLPALSREAETLKKGDKIKIFFAYRHFRLVFNTRILGKTQYILRKNRKVPALIISYPDQLLDGEKRNYFRVPTPAFRVEIRPDQENQDQDENAAKIVYSGLCYEIAGGGLGIREDKAILPIKVGDQVQVKIILDEKNMIMDGKVRYKRQPNESNKMIFGIEFNLEKNNPLKFNKNIRTIMRYVMKRQRELLQ